MKTLKQLKEFLDSLSDEQLGQTISIEVTAGDSIGVASTIEPKTATETLYFHEEYFGFFTMSELEEEGRVDGSFEALKKGGIFFNVKF